MARFQTKLTEMCGIEHPIIQGKFKNDVPKQIVPGLVTEWFYATAGLFTETFFYLLSFFPTFLSLKGGMHYVGYAEMAAAVSNAGGLGVITALTIAQPPRGVEASK